MEHTDLSRLDLPEERTRLSDEQGGYSFYAYLSRMRYITRWGLMRNSCPENVQEHSHMVAVLAHALGLISRDIYGNTRISPEACATAALFHDAPEIITGDMPTPVKYYRGSGKPIRRWRMWRRNSCFPCCLRPCGTATSRF